MDTEADTTTIPAGSIVIGYDGSRSAGQALAWATDQAVAERRPLTIAHAIVPVDEVWLAQAGADVRVRADALQTDAQRLVADARAEIHRRAPDVEVHDAVRVKDARDLLLELSQEAALVVLGSRGRGPVRSLLLGSVGVAVTRHAACPVVVHRPGNPGLVRHGIVVGIDDSDRSGPVLEFAYREAALRNLPLTVLHCFWDVPAAYGATHLVTERSAEVEGQRLGLAEAVAGMAEKYPDVTVRTEVARGLPDDALVRMGERMNLIVVGAHHGGAASAILFGSVAASVVEHATCAVAVVPIS